MIDGNTLGDVGFKKLGTPYSEMDCQKFYEWCLAQLGWNIDLAGSNAWYRYIMEHGTIMTPEECVRQFGCVPKGATLFIHAFDGGEPAKYKSDGLGNASHIGICTMPRGKGAINSSKSNGCVCESYFKGKSINGGWNKVGLLDNVAYDYGGGTEPSPEPTPDTTPEPDHEPETMTAEVWAESGNTVNLRKKPSTASALVERIKLGETVEVLEYGSDWCKVRCGRYSGYMMTKFLIFDDTQDDLYCVTIHDLPKSLAEEIANIYGGSITKEARG